MDPGPTGPRWTEMDEIWLLLDTQQDSSSALFMPSPAREHRAAGWWRACAREQGQSWSAYSCTGWVFFFGGGAYLLIFVFTYYYFICLFFKIYLLILANWLVGLFGLVLLNGPSLQGLFQTSAPKWDKNQVPTFQGFSKDQMKLSCYLAWASCLNGKKTLQIQELLLLWVL